MVLINNRDLPKNLSNNGANLINVIVMPISLCAKHEDVENQTITYVYN